MLTAAVLFSMLLWNVLDPTSAVATTSTPASANATSTTTNVTSNSVIWFEMPGACLRGYNTEEISDVSYEECKQLCLDKLTPFRCRSLEYKPSRTCTLSNEDKSTASTYTNDCLSDVEDIQYADFLGRAMTEHSAKRCHTHFWDKIRTDISLRECQDTCVAHTDCKFADYEYTTSKCYIFESDHNYLVEKRSYWLKNCSHSTVRSDFNHPGNNSEQPKVINATTSSLLEYPNRCISGFNTKRQFRMSYEACIDACKMQIKWCKSIDYDVQKKICYLSAVDRPDVPDYFQICFGFRYADFKETDSKCRDGQYLSNDEVCEQCPAGHKCFEDRKLPCPAGQFQDQIGWWQCRKCPPGMHQPDQGAFDCIPCPQGLFCNTTTQAFPCPAGSHQPIFQAVKCNLCPGGSYQPSEASMECLTCPPGYMCPIGAVNPTPCPPGTYQDEPAQSVCILCPYGYTQPNTASPERCKICPPGFSCHNRAGLPEKCSFGQVSGEEDGKCKNCPSGTFKDENTCKPCPSGHLCKEGVEQPKPCSLGYYQPTGGQYSCLKCKSNEYTTDIGQERCQSCPSGHYCKNGKVPIACKPGSYSKFDEKECRNCNEGTFQPKAGQSECLSCPTGHYCANTGMTTAIPCPRGKYQPLEKERTCKNCPTGHFCPYLGTVFPTGCEAGTYQANSGAMSCLRCPKGMYQIHRGASNCNLCPAGYNCAVDSLSINAEAEAISEEICPPGHIFKDSFCTACNEGWFQPSTNATDCIKCPEGYRCPRASSIPIACEPGTYSDGNRCLQCKKNTYSIESASVSCKSCPDGHMCTDPAGSPIPCDPGTYMYYRRKCTPCAAGTFQPNYAEKGCRSCAVGHYCPEGSSNPVPCKPGFLQRYQNRAKCSECPRGRYCPNSGMSTSFYCPVGHFQNMEGQTQCKKCPQGRFKLDITTRECEQCPAGHYCPTPDAAPIPCPVDHYQTTKNQVECYPCPAMRFQKETGQTKCLECPAGHACPFLFPQGTEISSADLKKNAVAGTVLEDLLPYDIKEIFFIEESGEADLVTEETAHVIEEALEANYSSIIVNGELDIVIEETEEVDHSSEQRVNKPNLENKGTSGKGTGGDADSNDELRKGKNGPKAGGDAGGDGKPKHSDGPTKEDLDKPIPCKAGYYSPKATGQCNPCNPGHMSTTSGKGSCDRTPDGTYGPGKGNSQPYPCPNGYAVFCHAEPGCKKCPPGQSSGHGKRFCEPDNSCDGNALPNCALNQGKCLLDSALNMASGGAYGLAQIGVDLALNRYKRGIIGNRVFGPQLQKKAKNVLKNYFKNGPSQLISKKTQSNLQRTTALANTIKAGLALASDLNNRADRGRQDINLGDVAYHGAQFLDGATDVFGNRKIGDLKNKIGFNFNKLPKSSFKKFAKKLGKRFPLLCNVIEVLSPACRQTMKCALSALRKKRSIDKGEEALKKFTVLMSPATNYFRKHPEVLLFQKMSSEECRAAFRRSWSRDDGDRSEFISRDELLASFHACRNNTVPGVVDVRIVSYIFNRSFEQAAKLSYAGSMLEDFALDWPIASDAIDPEFINRRHSEEEIQSLTADLVSGVESVDIRECEGFIIPMESTPYTRKDVELFLLLANGTVDYSGGLLTKFQLPTLANRTECKLAALLRVDDDSNSDADLRDKIDQPEILFAFTAVKPGENPGFLLVCQK